MKTKKRAPRNRTIELSDDERTRYKTCLLKLSSPADIEDILDRTVCQDIFEALPFLPDAFVDLLFIDPPYNIGKEFGGRRFKKTALAEYAKRIDKWLSRLVRILKPSASVYICSEWSSSAAVHSVAEKYFKVRNRITWEREKGRGALRNWKNCSEDIWFCTVSNEYTFNVEAVKLKRRVLAPYTGQTSPFPSGRCRKTPTTPLRSRKSCLQKSFLQVRIRAMWSLTLFSAQGQPLLLQRNSAGALSASKSMRATACLLKNGLRWLRRTPRFRDTLTAHSGRETFFTVRRFPGDFDATSELIN